MTPDLFKFLKEKSIKAQEEAVSRISDLTARAITPDEIQTISALAQRKVVAVGQASYAEKMAEAAEDLAKQGFQGFTIYEMEVAIREMKELSLRPNNLEPISGFDFDTERQTVSANGVPLPIHKGREFLVFKAVAEQLGKSGTAEIATQLYGNDTPASKDNVSRLVWEINRVLAKSGFPSRINSRHNKNGKFELVPAEVKADKTKETSKEIKMNRQKAVVLMDCLLSLDEATRLKYGIKTVSKNKHDYETMLEQYKKEKGVKKYEHEKRATIYQLSHDLKKMANAPLEALQHMQDNRSRLMLYDNNIEYHRSIHEVLVTMQHIKTTGGEKRVSEFVSDLLKSR